MTKIKVIIVDDNEETREGTQRLIEIFDEEIEIIGYAENGQAGIQEVLDKNPDVVLMDINMPVMNGIEATQELRRVAPRTQVIIVSVQDDPNYMRSAMRSGAVDFIAKPVSPDDLAGAIRRAFAEIPPEAVAPPQPAPGGAPGGYAPQGGPAGGFPGGGWGGASEAKVIAVMGLKGGVGKTTIAVNLAVGLAKATQGARVLLIDGNTYSGDVHIFLNTRSQYTVTDVAQMAQDGELDSTVYDEAFVPHDSGVKILVAPRNPLEADPAGLNDSNIGSLLSTIKSSFDYIVIDTSTTIDAAMVGIVRNADHRVVITNPTMPALKDAQITLSLLRELDSGDDKFEEFPGQFTTVLLNEFDEKTARIKREQISNFLKQEVGASVMPDPSALSALHSSVPLITGDPRKVPSVQGLKELVEQVQKVTAEGAADAMAQQQDGGDEKRGGFGGLFGRG